MNKMFLTIMMTIFLGGCATAVKLDLHNIDKDAAANLPKEVALDYLEKTTQKYTNYFGVKKRFTCIYSGNGVIAVSGGQEEIKYSDTYMATDIWQRNRGYTIPLNKMDIYLRDSNSDTICGVAGVGLASGNRWDIEYQKEFIRIAKKVATALKSLGVKVKSEQ